MLSKMANPQTPLANASNTNASKEPLANAKTKYNYSYKEIANKDLSKCKVVELKALAKTLDIRVSGNKDELRTRITTHIKYSANAIKVQSWIRRKLVYMWIGLKGNTKNCVNDTDFYTLEPIDEIPYLYYMQYTGPNVKYGFNISSLISSLSKTTCPDLSCSIFCSAQHAGKRLERRSDSNSNPCTLTDEVNGIIIRPCKFLTIFESWENFLITRMDGSAPSIVDSLSTTTSLAIVIFLEANHALNSFNGSRLLKDGSRKNARLPPPCMY
jgi:hypothetical protein